MIEDDGATFTAAGGSGRWQAVMTTSGGALPLWATLLLAVATLAVEVLADNRPPEPPPIPVLECFQVCEPWPVLAATREGCSCAVGQAADTGEGA